MTYEPSTLRDFAVLLVMAIFIFATGYFAALHRRRKVRPTAGQIRWCATDMALYRVKVSKAVDAIWLDAWRSSDINTRALIGRKSIN